MWRLLEEGRECGFWSDGDNASVIEPDSLEDQAEQLALRVGVGFQAPEDAEVVEHASGLVEVRQRIGRELGELCVDRLAAGEVVGPVEVAELVEVAHASQALLERDATLGDLRSLGGRRRDEAIKDLLAQVGTGLEVGDEGDELLLDRLSRHERLVTGVVGAAGGAVVAGDELAADGGAVHLALAALAAGEAAQQVAVGGSAGLERAGALAAHLADAVEEFLLDDRLVQAADLLAAVATR